VNEAYQANLFPNQQLSVSYRISGHSKEKALVAFTIVSLASCSPKSDDNKYSTASAIARARLEAVEKFVCV